MSIRLLDYRSLNVLFTPNMSLLDYLYDIDGKDQDLPSISYKALYPEDDKNTFFIHFTIQIHKLEYIEDEEDLGKFEVDFLARFKNEKKIDSKFRESHFPRVNAPAIAYPFLRAFINNFFINAGYDSVLLPTYNFTKSESSD